MILKVCPGLFSDPRHIQGQFFYLTGAGISQQIEENLEGHLGLCLLQLSISEVFISFRELGRVSDQCKYKY